MQYYMCMTQTALNRKNLYQTPPFLGRDLARDFPSQKKKARHTQSLSRDHVQHAKPDFPHAKRASLFAREQFSRAPPPVDDEGIGREGERESFGQRLDAVCFEDREREREKKYQPSG